MKNQRAKVGTHEQTKDICSDCGGGQGHMFFDNLTLASMDLETIRGNEEMISYIMMRSYIIGKRNTQVPINITCPHPLNSEKGASIRKGEL